MKDIDRNNMLFWGPKLEAIDVPSPATLMVDAGEDLVGLLDGSRPDCFLPFISKLRNAADTLGGYPVFLRSGNFSGKHQWSDTCYIVAPADFPQHVYNIVEESHLVDVLGLATRYWAVREYLKANPNRYRCRTAMGRPIIPESRCFFRDHLMVCQHPYWPPKSLHGAQNQAEIERLNACLSWHNERLEEMTNKVAAAFDGYWSLDWMYDGDKWWAIDMAEGHRSWHWPGCEFGDS